MAFLIVTFVVLLGISSAILLAAARPTRHQQTVGERVNALRNPRRALTRNEEELELSDRSRLTLSRRITVQLDRLRLSAGLKRLLLESRSRLEPGAFVLLSAAFAAGLCLVSVLALKALAADAALFLVGAALPALWLRQVRARRSRAFEQQLPDAIDLMTRALRAGHSMQQTLELIGEQTRAPLGEEFMQVQQQQRFGRPFRDALLEMGERVPSKDLHFVITAILVQKETGGDLIEILDRTTEVIRERLRVAGEIRIYTAQGRLTGWILSLLPCLMLAAISIVSPGYAAVLFHDPLGEALLVAGVVMILVGGLIIRRIVDVEV